MGFFNQTISDVFKPEPEVKTMPKQVKRNYEGGRVSRYNSRWMASANSADTEILSSLDKLTARARQVCRDNPYCRQGQRSFGLNVIGQGVRMQAQTRMKRGSKLDKKTNDIIEETFKDWCRYDSCSANGRDCFADIQLIIAKQLFEAGEIFVRLIKKPFGRSSIPLGIELLEPEQLDSTYNGSTKSKNNTWRMGIERDQFNRAVRFAFYKKHPGDDSFPTPMGIKRHMLINADEIIHLFVSDRASQTRGISMLAPALEAMHQLAGMTEAVLIKQRASSALMAFIQTNDPDGLIGDGEVYENERVSTFEPGKFVYLNQNETINVPDLDTPAGEFEPFNKIILRSLASGCGVSYESVSKDFSETNYSSSRLSLLEDRDHYKMIQKYLEERFLQPLFDLWLDLAVLSGTIDLSGYELDPDKYKKVRWLFRGWAYVDPQKEIAAAKEAVKAGFKTQAQVISEMGSGDIEEFLPARKLEVEQQEQLGLFFDTTIPDTSKQQTGTNIESNDTDTNGKET